MGKKRIAILAEEKGKKETKKSLKGEKGVRIPGLKGGERVVAVTAELPPEEKPATIEAQKKKETQKKIKPKNIRGKKYLAARAKIDPARLYSLSEAVRLAKETFLGKFDGSLEVHLVTTKTGLCGEVALPYFQSKVKKVEVANQETLKKIESGKIDFDILISTPAFMSNLVKYAKVLGPRGLMPNPKSGTIVEDPEKAIGKFQKETFSFRTETNAPLIHTVFGKVSQKNEELEANLHALIQAINPKNIKKLIIKATMGPGIKVAVDNL